MSERRVPVVEDLLGLSFVSDPQVSPDARTVAAVVTTIVTHEIVTPGSEEPAGDDEGASGARASKPPRYRSRIHLFPVPQHGTTAAEATDPAVGVAGPGENAGVSTDDGWRAVSGGGGTEFTRTEHRDSSPRFSPDGKSLAFLRAGEDEPAQLHVIALDGGEPLQLTKHEAGVGEFLWQPDGEALVYVSRGDKTEQDETGAGRRITRLRYRGDGVGFLPTAPADLYRVSPGGVPQRLTETPAEHAFGAPNSLAFAPGGETLYFCRAGDEDTADDFMTDINALDLAELQSRVLVKAVRGATDLSVSPSGDTLAYVAASRQDNAASPAGVWLLDLQPQDPSAAPAPRLITGDEDAAPAEASDSRFGDLKNVPTWLHGTDERVPAGERLLTNLHRSGRTGLVELMLDGAISDLQDETFARRAVTGFGAHPSGAVAFVAESPVRPSELFFRDAQGQEYRLSGLNDEWCERLDLRLPAGPFALSASQPPRAGDSADPPARGEAVEYWTVSPAVARLDGAVVLEVHGGPHTAYGNGFMFEFQLLAARGYHVVYGNPRGSSSYGHHFATCMLGQYGSIDADDVLAIASAATARLGLQSSPLHLTGGSYGGFMTNWLVGVSDRFRSAVSQRGISNWTSFYGTSDIGPSFVERELCGVPWNDLELLWRQSPLRNVAAITTPLLIIHSEEDHRCPMEQAEQLFAALKRHGTCDVELLRFPGEGHELSRSGRPDRRVQRLEAIVAWFEAHA